MPESNDRAASDDEILIVDDNETRAQSLKQILGFIHYHAEFISPEALLQNAEVDLNGYLAIFSPAQEALNHFFLDKNSAQKNNYPLVMLAEREALQSGAAVVHLPFISALAFNPDYFELTKALDQVKAHNHSERRLTRRACDTFIGESPAIESINHMIEQVANTGASVLIMGESGTGKEVIARNVHAQSNRRDKPFIPINCGAIPAELLESELFGHEKGAFTGAISARKGRFELAEGGVIFLDEIGDMPLPMQVKLLRVLQERSYERVGSSVTNKTDVRVIAATHRPLESLISEGKFREDLYYRLNVFPIEVPPLRERREDIALLIDELITRIEKDRRGSVRLTRNAVSMLSLYDWPGNVRELANLIERLAILYPHNVVDVKELPEKYVTDNAELLTPAPQPEASVDVAPGSNGSSSSSSSAMPTIPEGGIDMKQYLTNIEIALIEQALDETNNVVARAASLLQMRRTTLVEKMRKYEIVRD